MGRSGRCRLRSWLPSRDALHTRTRFPLTAYPPNTSTTHISLDPIVHIGFASDLCLVNSRTEQGLNLFQFYNATHKPCRCYTRRNGSASRLRSLEAPCGRTRPRCNPLTDQSTSGRRPPFQCPPDRYCCSTSNWCCSSAASTNRRLGVHPQSEAEGETTSAQNQIEVESEKSPAAKIPLEGDGRFDGG